MAKQIIQLGADKTVLDGTEVIPMQESAGGTGSTKRFSLSRIIAYLTTAFDSVYASVAQGAKADTAVQSVLSGSNTAIDATDPQNPIVNVDIHAGQLLGLNDQTGTTYTLAASDAGKEVRCTNAGGVAFNINTQANVPVMSNFWCLVSQGGAGIVTITAMAGVTLRTPNGAATLTQYDARGVQRISGDEWRVW